LSASPTCWPDRRWPRRPPEPVRGRFETHHPQPRGAQAPSAHLAIDSAVHRHHLYERFFNALLGQYVVADPEVCHGQPTVRETRILVSVILAQVARGEPWDRIEANWPGDVTPQVIAEAVDLARRASLTQEEAALISG